MTGTYDEKIAAGMVLLGGKMPGWERRIDLRKLRLSDCYRCVVGQLFRGYFDGKEALGFCDGSDYGFDGADYRALTAGWRRAIRARLADPARATGQGERASS